MRRRLTRDAMVLELIRLRHDRACTWIFLRFLLRLAPIVMLGFANVFNQELAKRQQGTSAAGMPLSGRCEVRCGVWLSEAK